MSVADKLTTIAENTPKVYEAGQKAEHDRFWDVYQKNGERVGYTRAFFGEGWTKDTFKPKYNIRPQESCREAFYNFNKDNTPFDLAQHLEDCGVTLDTSEITDCISLFRGAAITRLPTISLVNSVSTLEYVFAQSELVTIDKIVVTETNKYSTFLYQSKNLENVRIEGVIGNTGISLETTPKMSHDSLMSFLNALKDFSTGTSGTSRAFKLGETNLAKLTDAEKAIATEKGWTLA